MLLTPSNSRDGSRLAAAPRVDRVAAADDSLSEADRETIKAYGMPEGNKLGFTMPA